MRPLTFRSIALFILQALIFVLVQAGYGVAGSVTITGVIKPLAVENSQAIKYGGGEGTDTSGADAGASNINLKGATVVALGDVSLIAGNNINVLDQHTESHEFEAEYKKTSGFLSKKTSTSQSITDTVATVGSQVSGKNVLLQAGQVGEDGKLVSGSGDIKIQGSDISASDKVTLNAGRDILIVPGQGTLQESHEETHKRSGLTDVCPYTLGVKVTKYLADGRTQDGFMSPVLERNTIIPASRVERFFPNSAEQRQLNIDIFQGEARRVQDNIGLGSLILPLPARSDGDGLSTDVRFTLDANGLLEVEAVLLRHGQPQGIARQLVIEASAERLSPEELAKSLDRMKALKLHPRDRLEVRALIARAERHHAQLLGRWRTALADAIMEFEVALETQDDRQFAQPRQQLQAMLARIESEQYLPDTD